MKYCQRCHYLSEDSPCSHCGNKKIQEAQENDLCFLVEKKMMWAEMLRGRLDNAQIPYDCVSEMGAGMSIKVGPYLENYQFFVPYKYYKDAKRITDEMFSEE